MSKSLILTEPVLIGREIELAQLDSFLNAAMKGKGTTVFLSGEAGSGKTRLINEFLNQLVGKDFFVLSGWCLSDVAVPYLPFMEALNAYFSSQSSSELSKDDEATIKAWLAGPKQVSKSDRLQNLTPQAWQDLTVAAVTKTLLSMSNKKTLVLFIDDLHWADSASLSLLHYVSRFIRTARVLILGTYRSEELMTLEEGRSHPLLETLRLMRREDLINEIKLSELNHASVVAMAEKMVGGSFNTDFAEKLAIVSQGNPLFVVESLRMLSEDGNLVQDNGQWRLSIDEVGLPSKIRDIILRRVSLLKSNEKRILDLASVIGQKFDAELLGAVLNQDSLEVLETLNTIGQSSSLLLCEGSYYEFDHSMSREVIYDQISPPLKKGLHERIADKMEAKTRNSKDLPVNELAYHYSQAGNKEKAIKYTLAAGKDALARYSNTEAARQFTYVLDAIGETADQAYAKPSALEGLGDALSANGLFNEALKMFEQLFKVTDSGIVKLRALRKAMFCSWWGGDRVYPMELGLRAEEFAQFDGLEHARLRLFRGFVADRLGKAKEGFEDMQEALRVFEEEYSLSDVAKALAEMVMFYVGQGRIEDQFAAALRSIALYEELEDLRGQLLARSRLDWPLRQLEFYQEALENIQEGIKIGEKVGDYNTTALLLWASSAVYDLMGDFRAAVVQCLNALEYAEKTDAYLTLALCYAMLLREYTKLGEIKRAEEFDGKNKKMIEKAAVQGRSSSDYSSGKALLLTAKGKWKEANELFERFFEKEDTLWGSGKEKATRLDYAWALEKQGRNEEAKVQLELVNRVRRKIAERGATLERANVQAYLISQKEIGVGDMLGVRLDLVNVAKNSALLVKIEGLVPPDFKVSALPSGYFLEQGSIMPRKKELGPFSVEPVTLSLQATKPGIFTLYPQVTYVDNMGQTKTVKSRTFDVSVRPMLRVKVGEETISSPVLPGRVRIGYEDLDALLFGGIPEKYSIALISAATDERSMLINRFLETGAIEGEAAIYITVEAETAKTLAEKYPVSFFLMVCNPQADAIIQNLPNVFKLKGVENLTEIDIALTKVLRMLEPSAIGTKRICVSILSDVLLQHHAMITRKWLTALIPNLKKQGFTVLAVINPYMHAQEEVQALIGLFDGEIYVSEKETKDGLVQTLRIRRLFNSKYLENTLVLNKEGLY